MFYWADLCIHASLSEILMIFIVLLKLIMTEAPPEKC